MKDKMRENLVQLPLLGGNFIFLISFRIVDAVALTRLDDDVNKIESVKFVAFICIYSLLNLTVEIFSFRSNLQIT